MKARTLISFFLVLGLAVMLGITAFSQSRRGHHPWWRITGNSRTVPPTHFLGTTDSQPLVIKTNGSEAMRVDPVGNVGIGTTSPDDKLDVSGDIRLAGNLKTDGLAEVTGGAGIRLLSDLYFNNHLQVSASYVVFTDGTTVYALNGETGRIDHKDTDAATVIRKTIARRRRVFIRSGVYSITSPLDLVRDFTLELEWGAILEVPNGYSSYVFGLVDRVHNTRVIGGTVREERPNPQRQWQAIRLKASERGLLFNSFENMWIQDPDIAIKLLIDGSQGWMNGNEFKSLRIWHPNIFIDFDVSTPTSRGFNRNYFEDIMGQAGTNTIYGARNIRRNANMFVDVKFWDMAIAAPGAISASIHEEARHTLIVGGLMTTRNFVDNGFRTQVVDQNRTWLKDLSVNELGIGTTSISNILTVGRDSDTDPIADAWTVYSSQEYKQDVHELTYEEYKRALHALLNTSVVRFRYKGQGPNAKEKIGVIAEQAPKEILAEGDSKAVSLGDYMALLHAAVKAQHAEIEAQQQLLAVQQQQIEKLQADLERFVQE